jgi:hypothetical protein
MKRSNPPKTKKYQIATGGGFIDAEGIPVGKYLAVRTEILGGRKKQKRYIIDHVPTGMMVFQYGTQRTAKDVAAKLNETYGELLAETDRDALSPRLRDHNTDVLTWGASADNGRSFEDWQESQRKVQSEADKITRARQHYTGKWIHFIDGSRYGKEGEITGVCEPVTDTSIKLSIDWAPSSAGASICSPVQFDEIKIGRAPEDMPWNEFSSTEIARIDNKRFVIGMAGSTALLWTQDVPMDAGGLSHAYPKEFKSREEAKAFAEKYAYEIPHLDVFTRAEENPKKTKAMKARLLR